MKLYNYLFSLSVVFIHISSTNGQIRIPTKVDSTEPKRTFAGQLLVNVPGFNTNSSIRAILQDKSGTYWFGTAREGVYRYNPTARTNDQPGVNSIEKNLILYTYKDGLCNNQIRTIQEDKTGNIWFNTGGGICRFDGQTFITFPINGTLQLNDSSKKMWKKEQGDLWFEVGGGVYRYHMSADKKVGDSFTYLPLPDTKLKTNYAQTPSGPVSPFTVYSLYEDKAGNLWFGTQSLGVCRYDGVSFTWFNDKGLSGPAVLAIFEDNARNLWFGNNGAGLFHYDITIHDTTGQSGLSNFTKDNGLSNDEFWTSSKVSGKPGPGTLARIYTINEDNNGELWIGTIDAGVWRYNPKSKDKRLINYTMKDGLTSNVINTIYKDREGELWFGTEAGICKFNGLTFTRFTIK